METITVTLTMPLDTHTREECIEKLRWFADSDHFSGLTIHDDPEPGAIHGACPTPEELKVDAIAGCLIEGLRKLDQAAQLDNDGGASDDEVLNTNHEGRELIRQALELAQSEGGES